jgi:transposase
MNSPYYVGVDVSKATLEIALEGQEGTVRIDNARRAIGRWLKELPGQVRIGVESTGSYHRALVSAAVAVGHTVYLLNTRDLSHYARAVGRRAKTDQLDAQLIARYLAREHEHLHPYRVPSELQSQIDSLIQRRHTAVVSQSSLRQSFAALTHPPKELPRTIRALQKLIDALDQRMQTLVAQDPTLSPIAQRLSSIVGFGPLVSTAMANAITRHPFRHDDAFIAFVGYDPRPRDSGQYRGRRFLSKRGPAELRRLLYLAAMSASKTKLWQPFYQRYRIRGFSTTATLVILARKLARIAFSIVKHGTLFRPELVETACVRP